MIDEEKIASEISRELNISKQRVSYHTNRLKGAGYIREHVRDTFKILELTQAGKNFLAMYRPSSGISTSTCRAENIRFRAPVYKMPSSPVNWHRVEMTNWTQYTAMVDSIKIKLNYGQQPSIEFIPAPVDGNDPYQIYCSLTLACNDLARNLEQTLEMQIGRLELSSKGEWILYSPLAKAITKYTGRVTVSGIGKINGSLPYRIGEFEFFDPRAAAEFMVIPRRLTQLELKIDKLIRYATLQENN